MRSLTDAEARVLSALVADLPESERERLRRIGLPRSTYHAARRRCYAEGWVSDRYVPDPAAFGYPWVGFVVARPYAERAREMASNLAAAPGAVVIASSSQFALGVSWCASEKSAVTFANGPAQRGEAGWSYGVACDVTQPSIPVYFDFEGAWSHVTGSAGTAEYPRGLGGAAPVEESAVPTARRSNWAALELMHRPFVTEAEGRPGHLLGTFGLPWSQRRLLESGTIRHRVFLDSGKIPPFQGRSAEQIVAITGELREGQSAATLLATLTQACRVFPLVLAVGSNRVLIVALGQGTSAPARSSPTDVERQSPMLRLRDALRGIEIAQEETASIRSTLNHRYDRLFPPRARR
ncbi:MAG: hypothetical protein L3J97_00120 [Thermoplasmata archaeon]|nr:hypothetical protein [Thermoplasmata archaeon]